LRPKRFANKGKKKTIATIQDLGSDSGDETQIAAMGIQGTNYFHVNSNSTTETSNDKKRNELFHIRVVSKHTKIETLFDPGSQVNLISEKIVKKLGLKTTSHPKPYPLGWVCDDAKLNVTKQCKVRFAIATKLIEEVEMDVVPLDICGIVLGSPYLYDRNAIFFRKENKYHLTKEEVEYVVRAHNNKN
jgi:hypothetical protein